jgi:hypothetical protein
MKPKIIWGMMVVVMAGCSQSAPETETNREQLTKLWDKVTTLEISHDTTLKQLTAALGSPDHAWSNRGKYWWGFFHAVEMTNDSVFFVEFREGKVHSYQKKRPPFVSESATGAANGSLMIWDDKAERFMTIKALKERKVRHVGRPPR